MDPAIARLETPEECEQLAVNVDAKHPELAKAARRRGVELRAAAHGAETPAQLDAHKAVYAYEEALYKKHGRRTRAQYTRRMIDEHGIIEAVEKLVERKDETSGYKLLMEMGMQDFAFEAVVVRHPSEFSERAVARSTQRLQKWQHEHSDA